MQDVALSSLEFADQRRRMVDCQLRPFSVTDEAVLAAFQATPREIFLDPAQRPIAYSDAPVSISIGASRRSLLTPMVLARLLQNADIGATDRLLDVAGGSGYSAAVASPLAGTVIALESEPGLTERARENARTLGIANVTCVTGPLETGLEGQGPFDVILVNGAVECGLEPLLGQLADHGRLLTIECAPGQTGLALKAVRYEKSGKEVGMRVLFDAAAPVLSAFARKPAFVF